MRGLIFFTSLLILIHALHEESDIAGGPQSGGSFILIHALHEESDKLW